MNILIIDDNKQDAAALTHMLKQIETKEELSIAVEVIELLPCYSRNFLDFDVIFMNPVINDTCTIQLACDIRKHDPDILIIFTADNLDYALDGYHAAANRFILKPYDKQSFFKDVPDLFWRFLYYSKSIYLSKNALFKLPVKQILYIEVQKRKTILYLSNGETMQSYHPLVDWIKLLKSCPFARPCRNYYINFIHVERVDHWGINMQNGKWIPISTSYQKEFLSDYIVYRNRVFSHRTT